MSVFEFHPEHCVGQGIDDAAIDRYGIRIGTTRPLLSYGSGRRCCGSDGFAINRLFWQFVSPEGSKGPERSAPTINRLIIPPSASQTCAGNTAGRSAQTMRRAAVVDHRRILGERPQRGRDNRADEDRESLATM